MYLHLHQGKKGDALICIDGFRRITEDVSCGNHPALRIDFTGKDGSGYIPFASEELRDEALLEIKRLIKDNKICTVIECGFEK